MVPGRVAHASGESPIAPCCVIGRRHISAPQQQPFVLIDIAPLTHELLGPSCCPQTFDSLTNTLALTIKRSRSGTPVHARSEHEHFGRRAESPEPRQTEDDDEDDDHDGQVSGFATREAETILRTFLIWIES